MRSVGQALLLLIGLIASASGDELRIVSWNIANLAQQPGAELRGYVRSVEDYDQLRAIVEDAAPDIIALQEVGSIPGAARVLGDGYTIQFETACVSNEKRCLADTGEIYTAIAYRRDLPGIVGTFQIDSLGVQHSSECVGDEPRRVRGAVGVKVLRDGTVYWVPSLHLKASCKTNRDESGADQLDDCATQRIQYGLLNDWLEGLPRSDAVVLAGDFNRELLTQTDRIRAAIFAAEPGTAFEPSNRQQRQCWSDFAFDDAALEAEAAQTFPELVADGRRPQIFKPTSNRLIDFFIIQNLPASTTLESEQIQLPEPRRFEKPSGYLEACDGTPKAFPGGRVLTFAQAYPSDHCPILLRLKESDSP